jgi:SAM-dependent methyltransferase
MRRVDGLSTRAAGAAPGFGVSGAGAGAGGGDARFVAVFLACVSLVGLRWATSGARDCGAVAGSSAAGFSQLPAAATAPTTTHDARSSAAGLPPLVWDAQSAAAASSPRPQIRDTFSRIYSGNIWGRDGGGSGAGSTLAHTATARVVLEMLIHRHDVRRLLDAPCGSAHWWPPLLERLRWFRPGFEYVGVDVVESKIAENKAKFAVDFPPPQATFFAADLAQAALPSDGHFDMSLCRDALQHLPLDMAIDVIANIARAKPRVAAFGSYVLDNTLGNAEIRVGDYYLINLLLPPFSMNGTIDVLSEESPNRKERKHLLLYSGDYLAALDFAAMKRRAKGPEFSSRHRRLAVVRDRVGEERAA